MEKFSEKIKNEFFPHTNVEVFANKSRLVIELKRREIFSYNSSKGTLIILDPIPIATGIKLKIRFDIARVRGEDND